MWTKSIKNSVSCVPPIFDKWDIGKSSVTLKRNSHFLQAQSTVQETGTAGQEARSRYTTHQHPKTAPTATSIWEPQLPVEILHALLNWALTQGFWYQVAPRPHSDKIKQWRWEDSFWTWGLQGWHQLQPPPRQIPLLPIMEGMRCWDGRAGAGWTLRPAMGCPAPGGCSGHRARAGMKRGLHGEHKGQPVMCECRSWSVEQRRALRLWWMLNKLVYRKAGLHVYAGRAEGCLHALPFFVCPRQEISFANGVKRRKNSTVH